MNYWTPKFGWNDPHSVTLHDILTNARKLIADEDYSVRDAIYASAVNGESDSAAMLVLERAGLRYGVGPKEEALAVFDKAIGGETNGD